MHKSAFVSIVECYVSHAQSLMKNYYRARVSLEVVSLFIRSRGKTVYILHYSDFIFVLLLVGFIEYDDDDVIFIANFV
ncbi:hypothetical protein Hanom_Chr06g00578231 [Helianthus anomalus]